MGLEQKTSSVSDVNRLLDSIETFQNGEFKHFNVDLTSLIGHSEKVEITETPEQVHERLKTLQIEYIAVMDRGKLAGITSKAKIGITLGNQAKSHTHIHVCVGDILLEHPLIVSAAEPVVDVLTTAFNRSENCFYDDVVLVDKAGAYLGLISMRSMLIVQNWIFMASIQQLRQQTEALNLQKHEMQQNMTLARQLQQAMFTQRYPSFPSHLPPEQSKLKFHHIYYNPDILGGDFFHIVYLSDSRAGLFMSDVLGHDVSSALITSMMRTLVASYRSVADDPGELLTQINRKFIELLADYPETMYATAVYLVVDVEKGRFEYANAGHPMPIKLNTKQACCCQLDISPRLNGPPLGILKEMVYEVATGPIEEGDLFLTYTDGLFEVFDEHNQQFGIARLIETFSRHLHKPPLELFNDVIHEVEQFAENKPFTDDVTLVGLEVAELN